MTHLAAMTGVDRVPWGEAVLNMDWRQGEHVTCIGPTGVGKTELIVELMGLRRWGLFLNTKRIDSTQAPLRAMGYKRINQVRDINPEVHSRYIIAPRWVRRTNWWPWSRKISHSELAESHRRLYVDALDTAFWQTGWTVAIDELEFINRDLKIDAPVDRLLRQGRSQKNTMVMGTQRPRHVTLHAYEQATHLFMWKQSDLSNVIRASELAGVNRQTILAIMPTLEKHDVLYVNTISGDVFVTNTRW